MCLGKGNPRSTSVNQFFVFGETFFKHTQKTYQVKMELKVTNKQGEHTIIYDDDKHISLSKYKWKVNISDKGEFYATAGYHEIDGKKYFVNMGRLLLGILGEDSVECDHANGNGLDNRMENIRIADSQKNKHNRRSWGQIHYKGVSVDSKRNKYVALIKPSKERRQMCLGKFDDVIEAAKAYDSAAYHFFNDFAKLNFPDEVPDSYIEKPKIIQINRTLECELIIDQILSSEGRINVNLIEAYYDTNETSFDYSDTIKVKFCNMLRKYTMEGKMRVEKRIPSIPTSVHNYFKI